MSTPATTAGVGQPPAIRHRIVTPEGVVLDFALAGAGERLVALLIDLFLQFAALITLFFVALQLWLGRQGEWVMALTVLAMFALRIFYFTFFEWSWRGRTPGKALLRLRVIAAAGGPLTFEAVLARNFTRELEVTVPIWVALAADQVWSGHPGWLRALALGWVFGLLLLPVLSPARVRLGDLIAGTRVILAPRTALLPDLTLAKTPAPRPTPTSPESATALQFTPAHLGVYGIFELQVLEEVLRKADLPGGKEAVAAVDAKIRGRIGWDKEDKTPPRVFLEQFYAAQRQRLEQGLLFGKRKERKDSR